MTETLAQRLRQAREKAGLSQRQLALSVGISPQAIQHIEAGTTLRSRYLTDIARALGVDVQWLDGGSVSSPHPPEEQKNGDIETQRFEEARLPPRLIQQEYMDPGQMLAFSRAKMFHFSPASVEEQSGELNFPDAELSEPHGTIPAFMAVPLKYVPSAEKQQQARYSLEQSFPDQPYPDEEDVAPIKTAACLKRAACVAGGLDQNFRMLRPPSAEGLPGCYAYDVSLTDGLSYHGGSIVFSCAAPGHNARPHGMSTVWIKHNLFFPAYIHFANNKRAYASVFLHRLVSKKVIFTRENIKRFDKILSIDFISPSEFGEYAQEILKEAISALRGSDLDDDN